MFFYVNSTLLGPSFFSDIREVCPLVLRVMSYQSKFYRIVFSKMKIMRKGDSKRPWLFTYLFCMYYQFLRALICIYPTLKIQLDDTYRWKPTRLLNCRDGTGTDLRSIGLSYLLVCYVHLNVFATSTESK